MQGLPHAPCRLQHYRVGRRNAARPLPPHAPCRLQPNGREHGLFIEIFASTRSVQIATKGESCRNYLRDLCLHTLRADCNLSCSHRVTLRTSLPPHAPCRLQQFRRRLSVQKSTLPPHAPCRLQPARLRMNLSRWSFASTRSVQIATRMSAGFLLFFVGFASTRSVQIAT